MLVILMSIHIIGAIIAIVIHCRDGTMKHASKYGDGFRFAKPSDIIFLWEIQLVIHTIAFVEDYINSKFSKHFHWTIQFKNSKNQNWIENINMGGRTAYPWAFCTQKSLLKIDFYINLFSVFRPFGRLDRLFY
mgnify:CR=1 FL=1